MSRSAGGQRAREARLCSQKAAEHTWEGLDDGMEGKRRPECDGTWIRDKGTSFSAVTCALGVRRGHSAVLWAGMLGTNREKTWTVWNSAQGSAERGVRVDRKAIAVVTQWFF